MLKRFHLNQSAKKLIGRPLRRRINRSHRALLSKDLINNSRESAPQIPDACSPSQALAFVSPFHTSVPFASTLTISEFYMHIDRPRRKDRSKLRVPHDLSAYIGRPCPPASSRKIEGSAAQPIPGRSPNGRILMVKPDILLRTQEVPGQIPL
jgi:hypothetical protein